MCLKGITKVMGCLCGGRDVKSGHDTLFSICNMFACSKKGIFFPGGGGGVKANQDFILFLFSHALWLHFF